MERAVFIFLLLVLPIVFIIFLYRRSMPGISTHRDRIGDGLRALKRNMERYAVMTKALLDQTEDEELLAAVLSNLWAKMKPDLTDALSCMEGLSEGRNRVFAIYAVTGDVKQGGMEAAKRGENSPLIPRCIEALELIGAERSAATLRDAQREGSAELYGPAYLECFAAERGKERMVEYIRANAMEFCDLQ